MVLFEICLLGQILQFFTTTFSAFTLSAITEPDILPLKRAFSPTTESFTTEFFPIIALSIIIEFITLPMIRQLFPTLEFSIFPHILEFLPILFLFFLNILSAFSKSLG